MSGLPVRYRVRLAYDFYRVGHIFMSPPMSRAYAETLVSRGLLETLPAEPATDKKGKNGKAKNTNRTQ
jgi:hypothetical protein